MSTDTREARYERRIADLHANDPQFAAAAPDESVGAAVVGKPLPEVVRTVLEAYADRPALGQRAADYRIDDTGRTVAALQNRFETITYGELAARVNAVAVALADQPVRPGDRVAILGFTSIDYTVVDTATTQLAAVSVPLQTSAAIAQLQPIIAETEPSVIASSIDYLDDAVALVEAGPAPARLVVFDVRPEVDDHRDALAAATARLADADVVVETLADVLARGRDAAVPTGRTADDDLALLIYTSGSTGAPKGAIYPRHKVAEMWTAANLNHWDETQGAVPSITLNFLPMSHVMGRGVLYATLAAGGTAYFAARSDLSTFLEDLALVRPTQMNFVPRIWDMLHQEYESEVARRQATSDEDRQRVLADLRQNLLGGRYVSAITGSAPIAPELKAWVEDLLDMHLIEGYGSTEAGAVFVDGQVRRPPVLEYKLIDVPDLGYFTTDVPHPRGELLVKSEQLFPGYYKRPEVTAEVFDADGFYRTGDVVAETGPDQLRYVDRRNNVLKLSQGEFVTVSKLEAVFTGSALVRQIFLYGNSARPYLLAVVVPTEEAQARYSGDDLKKAVSASLKDAARSADLQSYEIPRDVIIETEPFTVENGLLTGIRKLAWPRLKERYGAALEQLYLDLSEGQADELRALRRNGAEGPVLDTVSRAAKALLGAAASDVSADAHFTDLGGDSLSALTFANLLHEIFSVDVPVGVIVSPASDLAAIAAYVEAEQSGASKRPTYAAVHGRDATEVLASDLTLEKFIDAETLAAARQLPAPGGDIRTVLLTGATGFLGRYLALEWLERMALVDGTVVCLVRGRSDEDARRRLDATFDSGDETLLAHYRELAAKHLEVIAADKGEPNLGLDQATWQRLADTVDFIVDPAALVNHVLPYSQLFGPNALGTAELIRLAITSKIKPFAYVSTIGVAWGVAPGQFTEDADVREMSPSRAISDAYANGYGTSKWAGEVLLREANDLCGLPVSVFRCDMILADTTYAGQLNLPDMFTRMMLSLVATGVAPESFYELDAEGNRQRAHYDGLPVEFIAEAISTLGVDVAAAGSGAFETYHVMNPHDDGIGMDQFVDWLIEAGFPISRVGDYAAWLDRFSTTLRGLPERQRNASLLPLLHNYQKPEHPMAGSVAPVERFRPAVQDAKIGPDKDIPHVTKPVIVKYVTDLQLLGLL
ncbi:carboxylic acid reductase [Mycolicibacterium grossiae]|uniref:Carboxylic acid reductase n=1 Tax=Mycolicibacterium grossiae TaxID=1552759 RepID=A0A1E8Q6I1_9MYCO|nr:carboxylic acid reductase [Mycolicibacterium grossiae]OFJ54086.1 oxidoreductase [Mycolicibacterium grossiae]QEM48036.1 carboxylic acid reductase [Mycolicibacterium grossiae]